MTTHPLVRAAAAAAILTAIGSFDRARQRPEPIVAPPSRTPRGIDGLPALCGSRTIPEEAVCLPLPALGTPLTEGAPLKPQTGEHAAKERGRGLQVYDHIPRRPDRPADPQAYTYPIGAPNQPITILSGYDLDLPSAAQRRTPHAVGHGGIDIAASRREEVNVATLEGQEGPADVAFVGELFGVTVATSHLVREAGQMRHYVALYGHLDNVREGIASGDRLDRGEVIGFAGDSGSPGIVHLHLEIRQIRDGVSLAAIDLKALLNNAVSIPCDPRNILALKALPSESP